MRNLIHADFKHIRRSILFWGTVAAAIIIGIWSGHVSASISYGDEMRGSFEAVYYIPLFVIMGIFASFTIGREYKDGAIRNKVIVGHTRCEIFLSKILCSFLQSVVFTTAFLIPFLINTGALMVPYLSLSIAAKAILSLYLLNGVWMILFALVSLFISRQEISVLVNLALILVIALLSAGIGDRLMQPSEVANTVSVEMTPQEIEQYKSGNWNEFIHTVTDTDGVTSYYKKEQQGTIPNPRCPVGAKRSVMQFAERTLPYGQVILYIDYLNGCLWSDAPESIPTYEVKFMPLYSLGLMALLSIGGASAFKKKEFK